VPEHSEPVQRVIEAAQRKGVSLEVVSFDDSTHTAQDAARAVGAELGQIVKSLVFVTDHDEGLEPCLVLVSGVNRVDVSLLSAVLTEPRMRRATAIEAHELTGFSIGGIPPFGHIRQIRTIMDPDLGRYETVWAAAGTANAVFPVTPATLRVLANAVVTQIAARPEGPIEPQAAGAQSGA
jgi:prolyl-tRNA editing enzyme YbaK/EbsC (Cys-tRNA(Pro) deacylase)